MRPNELPDHELLLDLRKGWNNDPWTAHVGYMEAIARHVVRSRGPILECGSGATTVLIGALAKVNGRKVWSLEQLSSWAKKVRKLVAPFGAATVYYAPIVDQGAFEWFEVPDELPGLFTLVVVDGPWSSVRGGRSGVVPMMGARFKKETVLLMDDANRQGEVDIMEQWERSHDALVRIVPAEGRPYGEVRFPKGFSSSEH